MYIPPHFAETDSAALQAFMAQHSFATLVSHDGNAPVASALPLLWEERPDSPGRLIGHLAKANPQWRHADGQRVLAMFHGPHAYISPTWYQATNVVPTWNYATVHAYGVFRVVQNEDRLREIISRMVTVYEAHQPRPWSLDDLDESFLDRMLAAIVGFEIDLDRLEGKWKLSQNHSEARRENVILALNASPNPDARELATMMAATEGAAT